MSVSTPPSVQVGQVGGNTMRLRIFALRIRHSENSFGKAVRRSSRPDVDAVGAFLLPTHNPGAGWPQADGKQNHPNSRVSGGLFHIWVSFAREGSGIYSRVPRYGNGSEDA
jgi:hypothetical protein